MGAGSYYVGGRNVHACQQNRDVQIGETLGENGNRNQARTQFCG